MADLDRFVKATAEANGMTVEDVKAEALESKEEFAEALNKWWEQQIEPAPEPTFWDEYKAMRPNSSEKNRAIFRSKVFAKLDEMRGWSKERREQAGDKWLKSFPDEPLADILYPPEQQEPEPPAGEEPPSNQLEPGEPP